MGIRRKSVPGRETAGERPISGKDRLFQEQKEGRCLEKEFMFPLQWYTGPLNTLPFRLGLRFKKAIGIQGDLSGGRNA